MESCSTSKESGAPMLHDEISHQQRKSKWRRFKTIVSTSRNWIGAIVARLLFLTAAVVCIALTVFGTSHSSKVIYTLFIPLVLMVPEAVITLKSRHNKEWKWGTPCIFIFLMASVPSIWMLEIQRYARAKENTTLTQCAGESVFNVAASNESISLGMLVNMSSRMHELCLCTDCVPNMVQILLLTLIVGRWLLPKAKSITADQKAQLLLVNIAVAADILELFELLKEDKVRNEFGLVFAVLMVWSCSLLQFGVVSTATSEKGWMCLRSEMWALITLLCLDDLSFLILRVVCMAGFGAISYSSYFFTAKNGLVLMMDLNRLCSLHHEMKKETAKPTKDRSFRMSRIRR